MTNTMMENNEMLHDYTPRVSGSIYFLGQYRPAHFEATNLDDLRATMIAAVRYLQDRSWYAARIRQAHEYLERSNCTAWSADHCTRGVSMAKRTHDPFLDTVTRDMPKLPRLDYSEAVNA